MKGRQVSIDELDAVCNDFLDALQQAYANPTLGPLTEGLAFKVSQDGMVGILATEDALMAELIHFANTKQLRGGLLAVKFRHSMTRRKLWNRYVSACFALGIAPLGPTTPEQQRSLLALFPRESAIPGQP
jgi:hypothetical protein